MTWWLCGRRLCGRQVLGKQSGLRLVRRHRHRLGILRTCGRFFLLLGGVDALDQEEDGEGDGKVIDDTAFARKVSEVDIELMTLEVQMLRLLSKMSVLRRQCSTFRYPIF